jgi:hypothetical protein
MKWADLKIGDRLYYARPWRWRQDYDGKLAVVLATEPHKLSYNGQARPVDRGNDVLVELADDAGGNSYTYKTTVPLAHLRGPYDETLAEVRERQNQRNERSREESRQREQDRREARALLELLDRAEAAGFDVLIHANGRVDMSTETLTRLLDALPTATPDGAR